MGAELRDVPGKFSFRDAKEFHWEPTLPSKAGAVVECPELEGFYSCRGFISRNEARAFVQLARRCVQD
jgi:hypothetical protein